MTVPVGAIYGFIGENGSGKSTTQKLICGHLVPNRGTIKLFGKPCTDPGIRARVGALIENAGCFPGSSVYQNLMMQAINLNLPDPDREIRRVLEIVRMDGEAKTKFKKCSLGMKQRIGIAMALLGNPALLILNEPINDLDVDGMRLMRQILVDITQNRSATVLVSSHILGELEKIATHYGIIRQGHMVQELSAKDMEGRARVFVSVRTGDMPRSAELLRRWFGKVLEEDGYLRVYDAKAPGILDDLERLRGETVDIALGSPSTLAVGYLASYDGWELAAAIAALKRRHLRVLGQPRRAVRGAAAAQGGPHLQRQAPRVLR